MSVKEPKVGDIFFCNNEFWLITILNTVDDIYQLYCLRSQRPINGYTYLDLKRYINEYEAV